MPTDAAGNHEPCCWLENLVSRLRPGRKPPAVEPSTDPIRPAQPIPLSVRVTHLDVGGRAVTAIGRTWAQGETGHSGRCRLCGDHPCKADVFGNCLWLVEDYVP